MTAETLTPHNGRSPSAKNGHGRLLSGEFVAQPDSQGARPEANDATAPEFDVIGRTTRVDGNVTGQAVRVTGVVVGDITASIVQIAPGGTVHGDIHADEAVVAGNYSGTLTCTRRVRVRPEAKVVGTLVTPALIIDEGASVSLQVRDGAEMPEAWDA